MTHDPSLRARAPRYNFGDHGGTDLGGRPGNFVLKPGVADYYSPSYGDNAITVVRGFPGKDTDGTLLPYRYNAEANQFGDFIRRYPAVRNFGEPGVTFLTQDPADPTRIDPQMLPSSVLYNAITLAKRNGQEQPGWAAQLDGAKGKSARLSGPSELYMIQGAVMQRATEIYNPPRGFAQDHKPVVFAMSPSAGFAYLDELNRVNEGADVSSQEWETIMANGDPVSLDFGRYATFYRLRDGDPRARQQQIQTGWQVGAATQGGAGGGRGGQQPIGYGCYMEPDFNGIPARLSDWAEFLTPRILPWDEILHFPSVEEQAHLIADKFPANMILYAWNDHQDWIPESVRGAAVERTYHDTGTQPYPGAAAPAQAGPAGLAPPPQVGPPPTPQAAPPLQAQPATIAAPAVAPVTPTQGVPLAVGQAPPVAPAAAPQPVAPPATVPVTPQVAPQAAPPQAAPPQAAPPQAVPPQAAPPQAVPPQAAPPQAVPPQAAPPQAVPQAAQLQTAPPQAVPPQAAPPQAAPPQAAPPQAAPPQAAPAEGVQRSASILEAAQQSVG